MHFTTILLLLLAFIGFSSAYTNWEEEDIEIAQDQIDTILHAKAEMDYTLLYQLIPRGQEMDRYLTQYGQPPIRIVQAMMDLENRTINAIATIEFGQIRRRAALTLTRDIVPTGYVVTSWVICKDACELGSPSFI